MVASVSSRGYLFLTRNSQYFFGHDSKSLKAEYDHGGIESLVSTFYLSI